MKQHKIIRYSEAFKRQVVEQIQSGKYHNIAQARRAYGIRGALTVNSWLERYGNKDLLPKQIKIMSLNEIDEAKELKKRVRALETALADAQMRSLLNEAHLEIACERMKTDVETFKKNTPRRYSEQLTERIVHEGVQYCKTL